MRTSPLATSRSFTVLSGDAYARVLLSAEKITLLLTLSPLTVFSRSPVAASHSFTESSPTLEADTKVLPSGEKARLSRLLAFMLSSSSPLAESHNLIASAVPVDRVLPSGEKARLNAISDAGTIGVVNSSSLLPLAIAHTVVL